MSLESLYVEGLGGVDGDLAVEVGGCKDGGVAGAPVDLEGPIRAGSEFALKGNNSLSKKIMQ